jgi:hypothetical protein
MSRFIWTALGAVLLHSTHLGRAVLLVWTAATIKLLPLIARSRLPLRGHWHECLAPAHDVLCENIARSNRAWMVEAQLSQLLKNSTLSPFHLIHPRPECLLHKKKGFWEAKFKKRKIKRKKEKLICLRGTCGVFFIQALSAFPNST